MKWFFCFIVMFFTCIVSAQDSIKKTAPRLRWEASVGSGLYLDFWNIIIGEVPGYRNIKGNLINVGKTDRLELKYFFNNKSAISIYYQNNIYNDLIGDGNDPFEFWTELKRKNKRMHFTLNYNRIIHSGKKGEWTIASGFQVQIEKYNFPFYTIDSSFTQPVITTISGRGKGVYFENWAIPLTVAYHWKINKSLKLGLLFNTAYTTYIGIDGTSFQGNIAIPFGNPVGRFKGRRIITP